MSDANAVSGSSEKAGPLRPLYGEYASPEEQRRRIEAGGGVVEAVAPVPEAPEAAPAPVTQPVAPDAQETAPSVSEQTGTQRASEKPRILPQLTPGRRIDRMLAFVLVFWGLFSVFRAIPEMTNYPVFAYDLFSVMGIDAALSDPGGARVWGVVSALIFGLGWLATAMFTWSSAKRGRLLFWIPLVGALVFGMLSGITMAVPLMSDPAVLDAITTQLTDFPLP